MPFNKFKDPTYVNLLSEALEHITLTPDTFSERTELPDPESLSGCLLLADRGYFSLAYVAEMLNAGASFVLRTKTNVNPLVLNAYGGESQRLRRLCGKPLQKVAERLPKKTPVDLDVCWQNAQHHLSCRLVVGYNPKTREFRYLLTNLPRTRYTPEQIGLAYKLRWQIEMCQTQPIKMTRCPLRHGFRTLPYLRADSKGST